MNLDQKLREMARREKSALKRAKREQRRQQKAAAPSVEPVKS